MKKTKYNIFKYLLILADILILCFIFGNSLLLAEESSEKSNIFVNFFVEKILQKDINLTDEHFLDTVTFFVRKLAHSFEYFVLTAFINATFLSFGTDWKKSGHLSVVMCIIFAICDETIQYFVPGRACRALDVCIDTFGGLLAVLIIRLIIKIRKNEREN